MEKHNTGLIALGAFIFIIGLVFEEPSAQFLGGIVVVAGFSRKEKKTLEFPSEKVPDALKEAEQENLTREELDAIEKPDSENLESD